MVEYERFSLWRDLSYLVRDRNWLHLCGPDSLPILDPQSSPCLRNFFLSCRRNIGDNAVAGNCNQGTGRTRRPERERASVGNFDLGSFAMHSGVEFQLVCGDCGSLAIRIENPESASRREEIVYCGDCSVPRGTVGALRGLTVRPGSPVLPTRQRIPNVKSRSELVALHKELQALR
jgi:hypothetical protein